MNMQHRCVTIRFERRNEGGVWCGTRAAVQWRLDAREIGSGQVWTADYPSILRRARELCARAAVRAPVVLLIGDEQDRVKQAIGFALAVREIEADDFRMPP